MDGANANTVDQIELYWQPGCSGCLRAKEFLRSRGIDYVSINVIEEPERMDAAVARFGLKTLPLGIRGNRAVPAQNLTELAALIGAGEVVDETPVMSPEELVQRTDEFLAAAQRYARQFPADKLYEIVPYRGWDHRRMIHHVFFIVQAFVNQVQDIGIPVGVAFEMPVPDEIVSFEDMAQYGDEMRAVLQSWWVSNDRVDFAKTFKTRAGDRTAHQVLERACWHIGQHTRQVEHTLKEDGLVPNGPITAAMMDRLPLPKNVWLDV
jgi:glutaredoxin